MCYVCLCVRVWVCVLVCVHSIAEHTIRVCCVYVMHACMCIHVYIHVCASMYTSMYVVAVSVLYAGTMIAYVHGLLDVYVLTCTCSSTFVCMCGCWCLVEGWLVCERAVVVCTHVREYVCVCVRVCSDV
eukprot:GHVQ01033966.1.p2 GENE.GHVQ01033966.1~~GHVQ01033966.1.p2  ORF type:complete len:129 (-),score=15.16 GHVQ01033966.1:446-832(-)